MDIKHFMELHPKLYHMAEPNAWPGIKANGLLSTEALLDLFSIQGRKRDALLSARRPECVTITHPTLGEATIRDNKPMRDSQLEKCLLDGLKPSDWYQLLNRKTFFWTTKERLIRLLGAQAYRGREHCVITIDTRALLNKHLSRVTLSPYNSGSTIFKAVYRGHRTFLPIDAFDYDQWRLTRQRRSVVVELAVDYSVPDIAEFTDSVVLMHGQNVINTIPL